ncbi:MAG: Gfo/Idh/MocA family oxidoreductase [Solirubrobacterales bacterium]|nr:Gfo/Idh/MocA family oxidoreductase [Solirubrobacterales bacterium]
MGAPQVPNVRVAIIGYGLSGQFFHAPLIAATDGLEVASVVTSNPARRRQVEAEHPGADGVASVEELWNGPRPAVIVVASPNDSHTANALEAIEHGIPVVVDKPLAVTAPAAETLVARAQDAGVLLTVFQNRRWDTDQLTLRRLIAEDALGDIVRYESRFERWRPALDRTKWRENVGPEAGGGVLLDLGSHLVDQALTLFGPVSHVYAEVDSRRGAPADDDVFIALHHEQGTISHLHASAVMPSIGPRLRVQGTTAAFLVTALDPQEAAIRAGERPDRVADWGRPEEFERGRLVAGERSVPVPAEPGDWPRFYALLRDALLNGGPPPVDPFDAVHTLRVLDAARLAARDGALVSL